MKSCFFVIYFLLGICLAVDSDKSELIVKQLVSSHIYNVSMNEQEMFNYTLNCSYSDLLELNNGSDFYIYSENSDIVGLVKPHQQNSLSEEKYKCLNGTVTIPLVGGRLGIADVNIKALLSNKAMVNVTTSSYAVLHVRVLRQRTLLDELTVFLLGPLVLINKCAFGAKIETDVLKRVLKRPVELALCLFVQFILMPLIAIALGYMCNLGQVMALALLVSASCPGGGGGYVFSFLINGDITLAITASLMSTLFAMGAMPAVIGLYTSVADVPSEIRIPYVDIILILLAIAIPISAGMLIRRNWPKFASKLVVIIKPLSLFIIAGGLIIVIFTSRYVLYGPKIGILLAVLLPVSTFIVALALSLCFSFSWPLSKAISLESGLKNTVLGIAVIELSFPQPEADLASILIIMITIGHTFSASVWYFFYLVKSKFEKPLVAKDDYKTVSEVDSEETTKFINEADDSAD